MKKLAQIADVVLTNGHDAESIIVDFEPEDESAMTFLKGILDKSWETDAAAARELFASSASNPRYRTLKHKTRRHLLHYLFDLRRSEVEIDQLLNAHYNAIHHIACGQILKSYSAIEAAQDEFQHALDIADKFGFSAIGVLAGYRLEVILSGQGQPDKEMEVRLRTDRHYKSTGVEIQARRLFDSVVKIVGRTTDYSPEMRRIVRRDALRLTKLANQHDGWFLLLLSYEATMISAMMSNNFVEAIRSAEKALLYIDENPHIQSRSNRGRFINHLSTAYLQSGNYIEAQKYSDESLSYAIQNTPSWGRRLGQSMRVSFRQEDFSEAARKLEQLLTYCTRGSVNEFWREQIVIHHGFLCYIVGTSLFKATNLMRDVADRFNIDDFISTSAVFTRDKHGANIPRIILQVLMTLSTHNITSLSTKAEALRKYRQTYLKDARYRRASAFLKLLHLLIEQDYDLSAVEHKGHKYEVDLLPISEKGNVNEDGLEPILYHRLWSIVKDHVRLLQKKNIIMVTPANKNKYKH